MENTEKTDHKVDEQSRAFVIRTAEGSKFVARFDPKIEEAGLLFGYATVVGYSQVAEKNLKIVGMCPVPSVGGKLVINDKPWSVEYVEGEEVPLYEYENIVLVEEITHMIRKDADAQSC